MKAIPEWSNYYNRWKNASPSPILLNALDRFSQENLCFNKHAIDLGCGIGKDTFYLARNRWRVLAIDKEPEAITAIQSGMQEVCDKLIEIRQTSFELINELPKSYLINASLSLPFMNTWNFYQFWPIIVDSLEQNGRFSGSFLGKKDSWFKARPMTFLSRKNIELLFRHFDIELFKEIEFGQATMLGNMKHWHIFSIIAKKIMQ